MSAERFIDSYILIYQLDTRDRRKHRIAEGIVAQAVRMQDACISFQVVQECLNVVLRKAEVRLDPALARTWLDTVLAPLLRVSSSVSLYQRGLALQERWKFSFYDSLIVAAALQAGCKQLLTEDLQHGQRVESLDIIDPFRA